MNETVIPGSGRKIQQVTGNISTTVDTTGLATSAKQDTQTTELTSIKTAVETIDNAISGSEMQVDVVAALPAGDNNIGNVDVVTSALPTGAATSANQDTMIGHLDGVEGLLTTIDSDTGTLAGAVSGTEVQVDVVAALPAGTNNIGDVDIASIAAGDNNIGNVDIVTLPGDVEADIDQIRDQIDLITPDIEEIRVDADAIRVATELIDDTVKTLGTDTYTEATSKGLVMGAVRRDADTTLANTTNEFAPLQVDANGYLKVEIFDGGGSHTVDNNGTFAVQVDGNALTALQLIDDTVFTDDAQFTPGTSKVNAIGLQADESSTDSVDEGDIGAPRMTLDRKQITTNLPHTSGGLSIHKTDALVATAVAVKASAGNLYGYHIYNPNTSGIYVQFYNIAQGSTTVGTSSRTISLFVPAGGVLDGVFPLPATFSTAITIAATTTLTGSTAPSTGLVTNIFYL